MMHRGVWITTLCSCIISWVSTVNAGGQCIPHASINGETLKGHTFASSLANNPLECSIKCDNEPKCQSYNYAISQKLCELNNRTKDAKPLDLVPDSDRLHMTRWIDRVPLGSIPELPGESCFEIKASEGSGAPDAAYWLDPRLTGSALRAYCDMTSGVAEFCFAPSCQNGGTCVNSAVGYTCVCGVAWTGSYCEKSCSVALGMENYNIPDSSIQATSSYDHLTKGYEGRLNKQHVTNVHGGAWAAGALNNNQWLEVDFGNWTTVSAIATQGRQSTPQWVKKYRVSYSYDGLLYADYKETPASDVKEFLGNNDGSTVVRHELMRAIITRFIRIHPLTWHGWMSLRAEFYGCKAEPPDLNCFSPLGMESRKIPDVSIVASSRFGPHKGPERSRYNLTQNGLFDGGWVPQYLDTKQFLQIDLGNITMVTGIATRGNYANNWWVKSYTLEYGDMDGNFTSYSNDQEFTGNINREDAVGHALIDPPIIARFIKIKPKSWSTYISMRVELFGCYEGFSKPSSPTCVDALGMHNGDILDSAITASSALHPTIDAPQNGRLHYLMAGTGTEGSWAAAIGDQNPWLQVNLGNWTRVSGVATQGKQDFDEWVTSYSLSTSNGEFFEYIRTENDTKKIFSGNFDRYTVVRNDLDEAVITRYVRIHPETWHAFISMRAEFYGCRTGFDHAPECVSPLGMKNKDIPDEAITASSIKDQYTGAERSRLDTVMDGSYTGGWLSLYNDLGQWVQADLGNITKITAIATQGHHELFYWVTEYYLTYSVNGGPFLSHNYNQILLGNTDRDTVIGNTLSPALISRYIRLHPKTWNTQIAMRFELYGCKTGFPAPVVPPCQFQLGMQIGQIPDASLSSSSSLTPEDGHQNGRLHLQAGIGANGAWRPATDDSAQWIQVNFTAQKQVTAISIQGRETGGYWVTSFTLSYSSDGFNYTSYQQGGVTKNFTGNTDGYSVVNNALDPPINSQYLRVHPLSWNNQIALRLEFYGC